MVIDKTCLDAGLAIRYDDPAWNEHISSVFPDGMLATEPEFELMSRYVYQRFIEHKVELVRAYRAYGDQNQERTRLHVVHPERERALAAGSTTIPDIELVESLIATLNLPRSRRKQELQGRDV